MDGFVALLVLAGIGIVIYYFSKISSGNIPTNSESEISKFKNDIPKEFNNYVYCLDNTGIAFDLDNDKVLLLEGGVRKIYPRDEIRSAESSVEGAQEWYYSGGDLVHKAFGKLNAALENRVERRKAFDQSGIFIQVADIQHPVWQIKFSDTKLLQRYAEILRQYFEGTLKPEGALKSPSPNASKPGFCPHCGADCREYPMAVACHACHQFFNDAHEPLSPSQAGK